MIFHKDQSSSLKVQITGMGVMSSIGDDVEKFTESLVNGKSGIKRIDRTTTPPLAVRIGAEINDFNFENILTNNVTIPQNLTDSALHIARRSALAVQTVVISALEAWNQAQLHTSKIDNDRIGLVIAGHNTTQNYQYSLHSDFQSNPEYLSPRYALQFMDSNHIGVLSEIFDIEGEGFVCGGASASGNVGVINGMRLIQMGFVDVCLVAGVMADLSPMEIQAFHSSGAMGGKQFHDQPEKACRPFDSLHEGFIYGQASACIVLESDASVKKRNISALANVLGGAINLHASASTDPSIEGEAKAMKTALRNSNITADKVDYLNTHGSSSSLGDQVEIQAIENVFGDYFPTVWLNATKGLTGHCLYSAGIVEIIASVIQIQKEFLHPNINLVNPINPHARFVGAQAIQEKVGITMSNSFGFSGINTSIVLECI